MNERQEKEPVCRIDLEDNIQERVDENGNRWRKVYMGSGEHYNNWLSQVMELYGKDDVKVEEVMTDGLYCFKHDNSRAYRIWVKQKNI